MIQEHKMSQGKSVYLSAPTFVRELDEAVPGFFERVTPAHYKLIEGHHLSGIDQLRSFTSMVEVGPIIYSPVVPLMFHEVIKFHPNIIQNIKDLEEAEQDFDYDIWYDDMCLTSPPNFDIKTLKLGQLFTPSIGIEWVHFLLRSGSCYRYFSPKHIMKELFPWKVML